MCRCQSLAGWDACGRSPKQKPPNAEAEGDAIHDVAQGRDHQELLEHRGDVQPAGIEDGLDELQRQSPSEAAEERGTECMGAAPAKMA